MARRKQQGVIRALTSSEEYAHAVEESSRYLVVIDVHEAWAGVCTVMEPIFRKVCVDLDKVEDRLRLYTISVDKLSPEQRHSLPLHGCKPLFMVYKQRVIIARVAGANAPELESTIMDNVPPVSSDD